MISSNIFKKNLLFSKHQLILKHHHENCLVDLLNYAKISKKKKKKMKGNYVIVLHGVIGPSLSSSPNFTPCNTGLQVM